jgi:hypothetical protein
MSNIKCYDNLTNGSRVFPCRRTDGKTDMTKIIVVSRNFANAPKISFARSLLCACLVFIAQEEPRTLRKMWATVCACSTVIDVACVSQLDQIMDTHELCHNVSSEVPPPPPHSHIIIVVVLTELQCITWFDTISSGTLLYWCRCVW